VKRRLLGGRLARGLLLLAPMELENALETEVNRLMAVAEAASSTIVDQRPWWVAALAFIRTVVL